MNILRGSNASIRCLAFSPDGRLLASAGNGPRIRLWDVATGEPRGVLLSPCRYTFDLAFAPDGQILASSGADQVVRLWDVAEARTISTHPQQPGNIVSLQSSGREVLGTSSLSSAYRGPRQSRAVIWDLDSGRESASLRVDRPSVIHRARFLPGGREVALGLNFGVFLFWDRGVAPSVDFGPSRRDPSGVREFQLFDGLRDLPGRRDDGIYQLDVSPDCRTLAAASCDHVLLWDLAEGFSLRAVVEQSCIARSLAFSPDGAHLATCGYDGLVRLLDPADGSERASYDWEIGEVSRVAFAPGGMIAAAAGERDIVLWDVQEIL